MKQFKKLLALLAVLSVVFGIVMFTGCELVDSGNTGEGEGGDTNESYVLNLSTVFEMAQTAGYTGSLEELVAMFKGEKGDPGEDGVSIASAAIVEGHLILTLTDETQVDCGAIISEEDKLNAIPTIGENGNWFFNGEDSGLPSRGADGVGIDRIELLSTEGLVDTYIIYFDDEAKTPFCFAVSNARSIERAEIDGDGNFVLYYNDTTTENLGKVVGDDGVVCSYPPVTVFTNERR